MKITFSLRRHGPRQKKIPRKHSLQMIYFAIICVLIASLCLAIFFIYRMVDGALTSSETILRLRQEVSEETFRSADFERTLKRLQLKQLQAEPNDWATVTNPFQTRHDTLGSVPTATQTTTPPVVPPVIPPTLP